MNSKFEKFVEILSQYRCTHMHLQSECEKCVLCIKKFCQNIFVNSERFVKFVKLKTHENFVLYSISLWTQPVQHKFSQKLKLWRLIYN